VRALLILIIPIFGLVACSGDSGYSDLDAFMAEKRARPGGHIKPIPPFKAYKAFSYSAASMRSPFDRPIQIVTGDPIGRPTIKPDLDRTKEYLEQFTFDSLSMVGTLAKGDDFFVLIQDDAGGIHRVKRGNFVGRNHGKIVETTETYIAVIEIVSDGNEGWIERPRTIKLNMAG
jgi:type IV pilus assembly protein PilP